jgi:transcriptional accessory protein Tex/SPT6
MEVAPSPAATAETSSSATADVGATPDVPGADKPSADKTSAEAQRNASATTAEASAAATRPAARHQPRTQMREKTLEELGQELGALLVPHRAWYIAVGHGKAPRAAATKIRAALKAANVDAGVMLVNEAGLSSYANSELARRELPDRQAPGRMAISLGRRLQDPLEEILKVDPRHLGLGLEQGLVS